MEARREQGTNEAGTVQVGKAEDDCHKKGVVQSGIEVHGAVDAQCFKTACGTGSMVLSGRSAMAGDGQTDR